MSLKKDIARVFSSNVINLIIGIITGFLVPAFLSLDQYAYLKTFTLYIGFVGILHFGFIDGLYIKYGGKTENELDKSILKGEQLFLLYFQMIITCFFLLMGIFLKDNILLAFSLAILPINMVTLFQFLFQALGQFGSYSKITLITPNLLLVMNLFIIFILRLDNYWPFVVGTILINYIVFLGLEISFLRKEKGYKTSSNSKALIENFKIGIFIMIGNLSAILFYSIDRWFVKYLFSVKEFAFYSFAISMMTVINLLISSVTMTFYPYLIRNQDEGLHRKIKTDFLILGTIASGGYFAFSVIVRFLLRKYIPSLDIIAILFAGFPAIIVINALYVNLYKAKKQERRYFFTVFKMFLVSILIISMAVLIYKTPQSIAIGTTLAFYVWYIYSAKDFESLAISFKEIVYLCLYLSLFFLTTIRFNWWQGAIIYFATIVLINYTFYSKEVKELIERSLTHM